MTQRKKRKIFGRNEIIFLKVIGLGVALYFGGQFVWGFVWRYQLDRQCNKILTAYDYSQFNSLEAQFSQEGYGKAYEGEKIDKDKILKIADAVDAEVERLKSVKVWDKILMDSWDEILKGYGFYASDMRRWAERPEFNSKLSDYMVDPKFDLDNRCQYMDSTEIMRQQSCRNERIANWAVSTYCK